jgi:poly-gamma-glutamate capsule biosynthesis protein CapA/YwtB (metallophosphatase superfamily)
MPSAREQDAQRRSPPRDWDRELDTRIEAPFTVAAMGDIILHRPVSMSDDDGLQRLIALIRGADVGVSNFETNIRDERTFEGPHRAFRGGKAVAADVRAMGFHLLGRANNHALDSGEVGLFETNRLLEEAGLVIAGAGRHLEEARRASFVDLPKGRVGLVNMHTPIAGTALQILATNREGTEGGKAGVNGLGLTRTINLAPDQLAALARVRDALFENRHDHGWARPAPNDPPGKLNLFGTAYQVGDRPGSNSYVMDKADLEGNLAEIRSGKQRSHFLLAMIHAHEGDSDIARPHMGETPPDFLIAFARAAIDNGADMFLGTGPHILRGIEIYKGRPIFYGLGDGFNCLYDTTWPAAQRAGRTNPEEAVRMWDGVLAEGTGLKNPINLQSMIALTSFDRGRLKEIRLHPTDLRWDAPIVDNGIPRLAEPGLARTILERLQRLSAPFGTRIDIEGSVGLIYPANQFTADAAPIDKAVTSAP